MDVLYIYGQKSWKFHVSNDWVNDWSVHFNSNIVVECVCLRFAWELTGAAELPNINNRKQNYECIFFFWGGGVHSEEFFQHVEGKL